MLMKGFSPSFEYSDKKRRCLAVRNSLLVSAGEVSQKLVCNTAKECVKALGEISGWRARIAELYTMYRHDGFQEHEVKLRLYFAPCTATVLLHESLGILFLDATVECRGEYSPVKAAREILSLLKRLMDRYVVTMRDVDDALPSAPLAAEGVLVEEVLYKGTRGDMHVVHDVGMKWRVERG